MSLSRSACMIIVGKERMRKLIFSTKHDNGFIDHTAVIADDELREKGMELLRSVDVVL